MITYLIKATICSGVFLFMYYLLFEKERMHYFNRFYLLMGIIVSFTAPLITITLHAPPVAVPATNFVTHVVPQFSVPVTTTVGSLRAPVLPSLTAIMYIVVTTVLLARFVINITLLAKKISSNNIVAYSDAKLVLVEKATTPYSFLHYIFVNRADYYSNTLEEELFTHELTHVTQKHTLDVLFIELLQTFMWINPCLIFYKRAIQVNHEFLADGAVIARYNNITTYQTLLLVKIAQNTHNMFASCFNYLTTKKRLTMMTKTTPRVKMIALQLFSVLLIGGSVLLCSTKTFAQGKQKEQPAKQQPAETGNQAAVGLPVPNSATQQMVDEYEQAIKNATKTRNDKNGVPRFFFDGTTLDRDKMNFIYYSMTDAQRAKASKCFLVPEFPPPPKKSPTAEEFKKWASNKAYGVWVNDKRISNNELATLNPNDYCYYSVSGLTSAAQKNDGFRVQVILSTIDDYNAAFALSIKYAKNYYALHKNDK